MGVLRPWRGPVLSGADVRFGAQLIELGQVFSKVNTRLGGQIQLPGMGEMNWDAGRTKHRLPFED